MVEMEDALYIGASPERVFAIASDIEGYSTLIPEYRSSRIVSSGPEGTIVEREGKVLGVRTRWTSLARICGKDRVEFRQLKGLLRGMETTWRLLPEGEGTRLSIVHRYDPALPLGDLLAEHVVHRLIVRPLARKILASIKRRLEATGGES